MSERSSIAQAIRHYRCMAGLTPKELADKAGVTKMAVSNWESGANDPTIDKVVALEAALDLRQGELRQILAGPPPRTWDDIDRMADELERLKVEQRRRDFLLVVTAPQDAASLSPEGRAILAEIRERLRPADAEATQFAQAADRTGKSPVTRAGEKRHRPSPEPDDE